MDEDQKLLEEYRLAQEYALSVNDHTWQVATILMVASLGAFAIVASFETINLKSLVSSMGAAGISITLLSVWFRIMDRHTLFIQVSYFRMREIESRLGLWKNRYVHFIDNPAELVEANIPDSEKDHIRKIGSGLFRETTRELSSRKLLVRLKKIVMGLWFAWILFQAIYLVIV